MECIEVVVVEWLSMLLVDGEEKREKLGGEGIMYWAALVS